MEQQSNQLKLMSVRQVATYLGISVSNIDRLQALQEFPCADYLLGKGRIRKWRIETINRYLETKCKNPKLANNGGNSGTA